MNLTNMVVMVGSITMRLSAHLQELAAESWAKAGLGEKT